MLRESFGVCVCVCWRILFFALLSTFPAAFPLSRCSCLLSFMLRAGAVVVHTCSCHFASHDVCVEWIMST
uniref:Putative secreted protein n=1 Tax=Anopheles darlingi TaxID=43151 RepID=A0A2M4CVB1_ANODA